MAYKTVTKKEPYDRMAYARGIKGGLSKDDAMEQARGVWMSKKATAETKEIYAEARKERLAEEKEKGVPIPFAEEGKLKSELAQFTGTENYYTSTFRKLNLTDGIQHLRDKAQAYWLIDIVESVQHLPKIEKNKEFIVWKIEVNDDKTFKVTAWDDTPYKSNLLYEQKGEYTDFPMRELEFYQEGDVVLLRSEH